MAREGWPARWTRWAGVCGVLAVFVYWSYGDAVRMFFHLDDFWVLKAGAAVRSWRDLPLVFRPTHGFFFYRPVSTTGYFAALHALFGPDPVRFHVVHLAVLVTNAALAAALGTHLLASRWLGLAVGLVYAAAPGFVLAAYWIALFTVTGTAFFYIATVWAWVALRGRWRVPVTFGLFLIALLASEHAVSLPLALLAVSVLLKPVGDVRRLARALAPFVVVLGLYLAGKVFAVGYLLGSAPPSDLRQAYAWNNYRMSFAPASVLEMIGRYLAFGLAPLYAPHRSTAGALALGLGVVAATGAAVVAVTRGWWTDRRVRVASVGGVLFLVGLAPVAVLPAHVYSCYVGIAMLGLALAVVGLAAAVGRRWPDAAVAAGVLAGVLLAHVSVTLPRVRQSEEMRYVASFSNRAAEWLYALASLPDDGRLEDVVVPADQVTTMLFEQGEAQRVFLCAGYRVRTSAAIAREPPGPGRAIVASRSGLPPGCAGYACVRRPCRAAAGAGDD